MTKDKAYYGTFFWLATISFIVPLFVAVRAFDKVLPSTKPTPAPDVSGVDHNLWDYLVRTYVENGLIDYEGISRDYLFTTYISQLAAADPSKLATDDSKLALHCNAYNALVVYGVVNHKIHRKEKNVLLYTPLKVATEIRTLQESIEAEKRAPMPNNQKLDVWTAQLQQLRSQSGFFDLKEHIFAGQTMSLNHLEHSIIRPTFGDPRVHVALVCAAKSCPAIRPEAYVGNRIQQQLQDQAEQFVANEAYVRFDDANNTLYLSPILSWYSGDWDAQGGVLNWLKELTQDQQLKSRLVDAQGGKVSIAYNDYDWSLNSPAGGYTTSSSATPQFGSGSVPNE